MSEAATEIAAMEARMRDDRVAWFRDTAAQARYAELVTKFGDGPVSGTPPAKASSAADAIVPVAADEAISKLLAAGGPVADVVKGWGSDRPSREIVRNVLSSATSIVEGMGIGEADSFMDGYDRLPEKVQAAILTDLALGKPVVRVEASAEAVANFARSPEGAELVAEWGVYGAPRRVAVIKARFGRAVAAMGDDATMFWRWYEGLETTAAKAVLRELAR